MGERIEVQGVEVLAVPAIHGPAEGLKLGEEGEDPKGCIGFSIGVEDKRVVNLGDTVLVEAWKDLRADVLMVPIGGYFTMNRKEAARAVGLIGPKMVIPTHFHWKIGPYVHPARVKKFAHEMSSEGIECAVLRKGESVEV